MTIVRPEVLQLAAKLRAMGLQPKTEGVQPRERYLRWNGFSKFCAEQLWVVDMNNALVRFNLNWLQRQVVVEELKLRRANKKPHMLVLKYRKGGVTTVEQALAYWTIWRRPYSECITLAHDDDSMRLIFRKVDTFWHEQPEDQRIERTGASVSMLEFPSRRSIYVASTAGSGAKARGTTLTRLHASEVAFYGDLRRVHTGIAKSIGPRSAFVMESTPNGRSGKGEAFYDFWQAAKAGKSDFVPLFFPWWRDPTNRLPLVEPDEMHILTGREQQLKELYKLDDEQVKWWRSELRTIVADGRMSESIEQEHPSDDESCFIHAERGWYDRELCMQVMVEQCRDPIRVEMNGRLHIWEDPSPGADYVMGVDPAGGTGNDESAIVCYNLRTGEQAFTYACDRTQADMLGYHVIGSRDTVKIDGKEQPVGLGWRWANPSTKEPAFVAIERNNHGHATLSALLVMARYPRDKVYHHTEGLKEDAEPNKIPGWPHGGKTHVELQLIIGRILHERYPIIRDASTIKSIMEVGVGPTGAVFSGRDRAVGIGLAYLSQGEALQQASSLMYVGGKVVSY